MPTPFRVHPLNQVSSATGARQSKRIGAGGTIAIAAAFGIIIIATAGAFATVGITVTTMTTIE